MLENKQKLSKFARRVLREVEKIPLGETVTYKELARRIGKPQAARAVGNVLKNNKLFLFIPISSWM
jgi:methylated-DNA-[protein]-cysteine S-methyltransferase